MCLPNISADAVAYVAAKYDPEQLFEGLFDDEVIRRL